MRIRLLTISRMQAASPTLWLCPGQHYG